MGINLQHVLSYNPEFKRKAIELFNQGEWPETPTGVLTHTFSRTNNKMG